MSTIKYFDKNINRKSKIVSDSLHYIKDTKIPLPSVVEISDSELVIDHVVFVQEVSWYEDIKEFITEKLHTKIIKELSELNYKGLIMYSGFNEPLLNKQAYKQIASTRKYLPDSKIELITNGDVLNEKRLIQLLRLDSQLY